MSLTSLFSSGYDIDINNWIKYESFINSYPKIKYRPRSNLAKHHIHPKSMGGDNTPDNLIVLSNEDHRIAHELLYLAIPCAQTRITIYFMGRQKLTPSEYADYRKEIAKYNSIKAKQQWENPETRKIIHSACIATGQKHRGEPHPERSLVMKSLWKTKEFQEKMANRPLRTLEECTIISHKVKQAWLDGRIRPHKWSDESKSKQSADKIAMFQNDPDKLKTVCGLGAINIHDITTGIVKRWFGSRESIPEGYALGTSIRSLKGKVKVWNILNHQAIFISEKQLCPEGYTPIQPLSRSHKGEKIRITNGIENRSISINSPVPDGWIRGIVGQSGRPVKNGRRKSPLRKKEIRRKLEIQHLKEINLLKTEVNPDNWFQFEVPKIKIPRRGPKIAGIKIKSHSKTNEFNSLYSENI
jgi:hypothetical protein